MPNRIQFVYHLYLALQKNRCAIPVMALLRSANLEISQFVPTRTPMRLFLSGTAFDSAS